MEQGREAVQADRPRSGLQGGGAAEATGGVRRELLASWWIAGTLVPLGFTTWAAFLVAGFRARKPLTVLAGFAYLAALVYAMVHSGQHRDANPGDSDGFAGMIIILLWVGGIAHALIIRPGIKRAILDHTDPALDSALDRARERIRRRRRARKLARAHPQLAYEVGVGRIETPVWNSDVVDVNHAKLEMIVELPGVSDALARQIVKARDEMDGFSSIEDMGLALDLPAELVERLRDHTVFIVLPWD
jgi:hypothetical protein